MQMLDWAGLARKPLVTVVETFLGDSFLLNIYLREAPYLFSFACVILTALSKKHSHGHLYNMGSLYSPPTGSSVVRHTALLQDSCSSPSPAIPMTGDSL